MKVLGINALFHDPAAALVIDGVTVAAAEEERFSRRKHGHRPVPFAAWELPELAARWCLEHAELTIEDIDAVAYSYDPALALPAPELGLHDPWDELRQLYAKRAPEFLRTALPGLKRDQVVFVPHHVSHAASAGLCSPWSDRTDVLVLDGRGECSSHLAGTYEAGLLEVHHSQQLPHSLGLFYEGLTEHLGFRRSSDEYKVMALASYGNPEYLPQFRRLITTTNNGGFQIEPLCWNDFAPQRSAGDELGPQHADVAASAQARVEEILLELTHWLHSRTNSPNLTLAGGVALNCVANSRIALEGPYQNVWVQPAAGDAGTALGAALHVAVSAGEPVAPMAGVDLGRGWSEAELEHCLQVAQVPYDRPDDIAATAARCLAADGVVAWFQGRSEFGPRALGHRSLLAHPGPSRNLERLNLIKGRESFRPIAPMVLAERAAEIFTNGPLPSPYMLFVHKVRPAWQERIAAVVHVDSTARVQTVAASDEPLVARLLQEFADRTGIPVLINTSFNTGGRAMVDSPRDALECFGSAPIDLLALGPFAVWRGEPR